MWCNHHEVRLHGDHQFLLLGIFVVLLYSPIAHVILGELFVLVNWGYFASNSPMGSLKHSGCISLAIVRNEYPVFLTNFLTGRKESVIRRNCARLRSLHIPSQAFSEFAQKCSISGKVTALCEV